MKLAFIMPNERQKQQIGKMRESVIDMRPDQISHLEHLLRSWRVFGRVDAAAVTWHAVKRVMRDRP